MTLRQLLMTGSQKDIREFFAGTPTAVMLILILVSLHVQSFPEELRTKETLLQELTYIRDEKDFEEYKDVGRDALSILSEVPQWEGYLHQAIQEVQKCS